MVWLVAGLGNPGKRYERTRHNAGFEVVEELARQTGCSFKRSWRFPADLAEAQVEGDRVHLMKPQTYMNRSGWAIAPFLRRKGLALSDLIVIVDDVDLQCGRIRIRRKGSAGGHNGLKSIIAALGSDAFTRVRIGVGGRPGERDMIDHVLSGYTPEDRKRVDEALGRAVDAVKCIRTEGAERAMNQFNG